MRIATSKEDWKIVNIFEFHILENIWRCFFVFGHIWHRFYISQLVVKQDNNAVF